MNAKVKKWINRRYCALFKVYGIEGKDAEKALKYISKGYTLQSAVMLVLKDMAED